MRSLFGALAIAAVVAVMTPTTMVPASAAPPVAEPSPGYDARHAAKTADKTAARRRYYRRHHYYGPQTYYEPAPPPPYSYYEGRPRYYRPAEGVGPFFPLYGFEFGFGW